MYGVMFCNLKSLRAPWANPQRQPKSWLLISQACVGCQVPGGGWGGGWGGRWGLRCGVTMLRLQTSEFPIRCQLLGVHSGCLFRPVSEPRGL